MKDINEMTDEEIQEEIDRLRNMTDEEREQMIKEIKEEQDRFKTETVPAILKTLEDGHYRIDVCCEGLVIILKALLQHFGTKELLQDCIDDLSNTMEDLPDAYPK